MSDTEAMVNLMEHAATLLKNASNEMATWTTVDSIRPGFDKVLVAVANGQATLRMVAASVAPEGRQRAKALVDRLVDEYEPWADKNTQTAMTAGELMAVARFLRYALETDVGDPS
jgi:hypothetical protein